MYLIYDKQGKQIKVNHLVDYTTALRTGNYTKAPPGAPEPEKKPEEPKGERVEGIAAEPEKVDKGIGERPPKQAEEKAAPKITRHKK